MRSKFSTQRKQARLALEPVPPSSSVTNPSVAPVGLLREGNNVFPSGKRYAVVIETSSRVRDNSEKTPLKPPISLSNPSQLNIRVSDSDGGCGSDSDLEIIPARRRALPILTSANRSLPRPTLEPDVESHFQQALGYDGADDDSSGTSISRRTTPVKSISARRFIAGGSSYNAPVSPSIRASPSNPTKKTKTKSKIIEKKVLSDNDNMDHEPALHAARKTQPSKNHKLNSGQSGSKHSNQPAKSIQKNSRLAAFILTDEDDDGDDELPDISGVNVSSGKKRKLATRIAKSKQPDEEDEDIVIRSSRKRTRVPAVEIGNDDEEPVLPSPLKKRKITSIDKGESHTFASNTTVNMFDNEQRGKRITRRQQPRKTVHRTAAQKKIELLRRKRAGENITEVTSTESDEDDARALYDNTSDSENQALSEFDDEEKDSDDEGMEKVRESLRVGNRNRYDEEFVVYDEDEALGVPGHGLHGIPLQFTHHAHKPLKDHFRDVIDWMVQRKINPGFASTDEIYLQAFKKLGNEVGGYADSKFTSSVWVPKFKRALTALPTFHADQIAPGTNESNKCEACNRTGHPATFRIRFSGKMYNKDTLEEFDNDREDDSDDSSVNSNNESIASEDATWLVGRFCKANAETAHRLVHWKHCLNEWVVEHLRTDGHMDPEKLAERADWSKKRLRKHANTIVDNWIADRKIGNLYRDFKNNLDKARNDKQQRWG